LEREWERARGLEKEWERGGGGGGKERARGLEREWERARGLEKEWERGGGGIMIQVQVVFMCIFYFYVSFYSFFYVLFFLFPLRLIIFPVPLLSVSQRNHNKGMGSFYAPLLNVV
jgi:hypothetical protein